MLAN
jgi:hypothetical protein